VFGSGYIDLCSSIDVQLDGRILESSPEAHYKFTGKERDEQETGLDWFEVRGYDSRICVFRSLDPHMDLYPGMSPYAYCGNNPIIFFDPSGMDSVYFQDQQNRPNDNGTQGTSYTATIYVVQNGRLVAIEVNGGSTYPNSVSNTDNTTEFNTVSEGWHRFNNASGHHGGTEQGLNLVDENGNRVNAGVDPNGNNVQMELTNVHVGASNNGNYYSRGSGGCLTINPNNSEAFFNRFDWSGSNRTTGNSSGGVYVTRGGEVPIPVQSLPVRSVQEVLRDLH
jgi:RHS repeat-associated protein